ncbi:MAG: hypothetical protein Tsb005_17370 [Gammaproteobacteria bacterium]
MTLNDIMNIAHEAAHYVHTICKHTTTNLQYNELSEEEQARYHQIIYQTRYSDRQGTNYINRKADFLRLDFDEALYSFNQSLENSKKNQGGNCHETSLWGLYFVFTHYPQVKAEVMSIENGEHIFLILNRDPEISLDKIHEDTQAVFLDIHYKQIYPASAYFEKLKDYQYSEDETTKKITTRLVAFDPEKQKIVKYKINDDEYYDTAFLTKANDKESQFTLTNWCKSKLIILENLLEIIEQDLSLTDNMSEPNFNNKFKELQTSIATALTNVEQIEKTFGLSQQSLTYWDLKNQLTTIFQPVYEKFYMLLTISTKKEMSNLEQEQDYSASTRQLITTHCMSFFSQASSSKKYPYQDVLQFVSNIFSMLLETRSDMYLLFNIEKTKINSQEELRENVNNSLKETLLNMQIFISP